MKSSIYFSAGIGVSIVTIITLLIYVSVQQAYRSGANDPQIQMVQDVADRISKQKPIDAYFTNDSLDIATTELPFLLLLDSNQQPICSTGFLNNTYPKIPAGVLAVAKEEGTHRITWQPAKGIRMALVVQYIAGVHQSFYAVAGRSLREVESRVVSLTTMVLLAWIACILFMLLQLFIRLRAASNSSKN